MAETGLGGEKCKNPSHSLPRKKRKNKIDFRFKYYIKNQNGTKKIYIVPPPLILFYNN
jgi:hypothetical protein